MTTRQLFPDLILIKKTVLERFLMVLYSLYTEHHTYTFNHSLAETKILIHPSYAKIDYNGKQPKIVVKMSGYTFSLMDYFFNEFSQEYTDENGVVVGRQYDKMMNTSLTVLVQAYSEEEASDVADELAMLISFVAKNVFSQSGIIVRGVEVSETDIQNREQGIYQTMIGVSVEFPWRAIIAKQTPQIVSDLEMMLGLIIVKSADVTDEFLFVSDTSNLYDSQIIQVNVHKKNGDVVLSEMMQIVSVFSKEQKIKVRRGIFTTSPINISVDYVIIAGERVPVTASIITYDTGVVFPTNDAGGVGKTIHDSTDTELQLLDQHATRFSREQILCAVSDLSLPISAHEKIVVKKVLFSKKNRLLVKRGQESSSPISLPQNSIVFYHPEFSEPFQRKTPGIHVWKQRLQQQNIE